MPSAITRKQEKLVQKNPETTKSRSTLGASLNTSALIAFDAGQFAEAKDHIQRAIDSQKQALALSPSNPNYRRFLKNQYTILSWIAEELQDEQLKLEAQAGLDFLL